MRTSLYIARELGYTFEEFAQTETVYNLKLWDALAVWEKEEARKEELKREALANIDKNRGMYTRGH